MARYKGDLNPLIKGIKQLDQLKESDKVLIAEGCTHHRQCDDIGTYKIPKWINERLDIKPEYHFTSGTEFPENLEEFKLIIHCGACMLNDKEVQSRIAQAVESGIPITNYGIFIAYVNGILERTLNPFKDLYNLLKN